MKAAISVTLYVSAILAANVLTQHYGLIPAGFGLLVPAGTYAAGFALLARDFVHRNAGVWWVLVGIALGIGLSWFFASPALALASAAAFGIAELVDMLVFMVAQPRGFIKAAAASNLVSGPVDTLVFLTIAGFPLTWETFGGQILVKLVWATALPLFAYWLITRHRKDHS
jgi:uncharacterized PurR-regulated membrane protein YhhQ (DUF165 family)